MQAKAVRNYKNTENDEKHHYEAQKDTEKDEN